MKYLNHNIYSGLSSGIAGTPQQNKQTGHPHWDMLQEKLWERNARHKEAVLKLAKGKMVTHKGVRIWPAADLNSNTRTEQSNWK